MTTVSAVVDSDALDPMIPVLSHFLFETEPNSSLLPRTAGVARQFSSGNLKSQVSEGEQNKVTRLEEKNIGKGARKKHKMWIMELNIQSMIKEGLESPG